MESIRKKRVRKVGSGGAGRGGGSAPGHPRPLPPRTGGGEAWWARARPPSPRPRSPSPVPVPSHPRASPAPAQGWRAGSTRVAREVVRGGGAAAAAGVQPLCRIRAGDTERESPNRRGFGKAPVTQFPQPCSAPVPAELQGLTCKHAVCRDPPVESSLQGSVFQAWEADEPPKGKMKVVLCLKHPTASLALLSCKGVCSCSSGCWRVVVLHAQRPLPCFGQCLTNLSV